MHIGTKRKALSEDDWKSKQSELELRSVVAGT